MAEVPPLPTTAGEEEVELPEGAKRFPCSQCGASLVFAPGTTRLKCPYCRNVNEIPADDTAIQELDYQAFLHRLAEQPEAVEVKVLTCGGCTAELNAPDDATAFDCPFCGHALNTQAHSQRLIKPRALVPFAITRDEARARFKAWLKARWFLPNKLVKYTRQDDKLVGVYLPHWTFDSQTESDYRGQRGDHYWENQSYTTRENGKTVRKTRRVRKTRWRSASGHVSVGFDDVLVPGNQPGNQGLAHKLDRWELSTIVPFDEAYLAGFRAEVYDVELPDAFADASEQMDVAIRSAVRRDIGGDEQRIHHLSTQHHEVSFKHLLLPVWASAYRWKGKSYRFAINGQTGRVKGERPYSFWKILVLVLGIVAGVGIAAALVVLSGAG